jgi:hypothetical protein
VSLVLKGRAELQAIDAFSLTPSLEYEFEKQDTGAYLGIAGKGSANSLYFWRIFRIIDRNSTINFGASDRIVPHA